LQSLQPVCKPSGRQWDAFANRLDSLADAEVSVLPFVDRSDALGDAQVSRFVFATRSNTIEDACNLKCARLDAHLARPNGS